MANKKNKKQKPNVDNIAFIDKPAKNGKAKDIIPQVALKKEIIKNQDKSTWEGLYNYWLVNSSAKYPYFLEWLQLKCHTPKFKAQE